MFCQKCGAQLPDDAVFCQKCGEHVAVSNANEQTTVEPVSSDIPSHVRPTEVHPTTKQESSSKVPIDRSKTGIYNLMRDSISRCPKIKTVTPAEKRAVTIVKGSVYDYVVNIVDERINVGRMPTLPFRIPFIIIVAFLAWVAAGVGWDMVEGLEFNEFPTMQFAIGLIAVGIWGTFTLLLGRKEAEQVLAHIYDTLKPVASPPDAEKKGLSVITLIVYLAAALAGGIILTVVTLDNSDTGKSDERGGPPSSYSPSPVISDTNEESVSLSQNYTNDEEGFSLNYPETWINMDNAELNQYQDTDSIVGFFARNDMAAIVSRFDARIFVDKRVQDKSYTATESEWLEMLSGFLEEVEIIDLSSIYLSDVPARKIVYSYKEGGNAYVLTEYFYMMGSEMYDVSCLSLSDYYDQYEAVFDAIMDSYTITRTVPVASQPTPTPEPDGLIYEHPTTGFTLIVPEDWEYLCLISENEYGVSFFNASNYDAYGGFLFGIYVGTEYELDDYLEWGADIIWQDGNIIAICDYPTDVQFDWDSPALQEEYTRMSDAIPDIIATFHMD